MSGAGTDSSKPQIAIAGPAIVLVEPQMPENIGAAARAMTNFGLSDLRLVRPQARFPHPKARAMASGAVQVLDAARVFDTVEEAVADLGLLFATTARERGQAKPVDGPAEAVALMLSRQGEGAAASGVLFGRERTGLENDEVSLADRVLTFPVNPAFASLNLSQAVLLVGYEWFKAASGALPFDMPQQSPPAEKRHLLAFFAHLEAALERAGFFYPVERRPIMVRNLRNIFHRPGLSEQDIQTLHGAVAALEEGGRGPSRRDRRLLKLVEDDEP